MSTLRSQLNQLRQSRGIKPAQQRKPTNGKPGKPGKRPAPAQEADPNGVITHACGHKTGCRFLQQSKCGYCVRQARLQRPNYGSVEAREARMAKLPRLPDGAIFHVEYDAAGQKWRGTLTVGEVKVEGEASGVFKLMEALDKLYRATCEQKVTPAT